MDKEYHQHRKQVVVKGKDHEKGSSYYSNVCICSNAGIGRFLVMDWATTEEQPIGTGKAATMRVKEVSLQYGDPALISRILPMLILQVD